MTTSVIPNKNRNHIEMLSIRLQKIDKKLAKEIKNFLPEWWESELINSPSAVQQALISVAKFTNLNIKSVLNSDALLQLKEEGTCRYKHANNRERSELAAATAIVQSLASTVSDIVTSDFRVFQSAETIRDTLLNENNSWVDLKSLVNYCWEFGVPVLYLPSLPTSKKMDAVVVNINGRPVISLTKKYKHESELLFLLAHEMGHVFHRHLEVGQTLIDKKVNSQNNDLDEQENQANAFAIELLTGIENTKFHSRGRQYLKASDLAVAAKEKGGTRNIDPGHVVLNWGYTTSKWATAKAALNILYPHPDWEEYMKNKLCETVEEHEADEDQLDYLYKLMNIEG